MGTTGLIYSIKTNTIIRRTNSWRKQLEVMSEMNNVRAVRCLGMDHIDVSDVPLFMPFNGESSDEWFIANMYEAKEFLKRMGMKVDGDVEKDLDEKRVRLPMSTEAPF